MMFISEFDRCFDADVHLLHSSIACIFPPDIMHHLTSFIGWHCSKFINVSKKNSRIPNGAWIFFSTFSIQTDTVGNEILFWVGRDFQCIRSRGSKVLTTYVFVPRTFSTTNENQMILVYGRTHLRASNGTQ